mgnify:CR=1 FL=1
MKKNTAILTTVTLVGLFLVGCAASAAQVKRIDMETAKANAIEAAGFSSEDVRFSSVELDRRNGVEYYDVDFVADGAEYEYDIDALTGQVIASKSENRHKDQKTQTVPVVESEKQSASITEAEAKKIALSQVPGADESHIYKFSIDYDDGKLEYEGSIIFEEMEYEFEIDGHSGAIRGWEAESIYD